MAALSNKLENVFIDWFFRGQPIGLGGASAALGTGPTSLYFGLFTTIPLVTGLGGTEVTTGAGTNYSRVALVSNLTNWTGTSAAGAVSTGSSGMVQNAVVVTFPAPAATTAWGLVTSFGLFDAATVGNLLYFGLLTGSKNIGTSDPAPSFAAGAFQITFS